MKFRFFFFCNTTNLIELQNVEKLEQFFVFLVLFQLDVVLLKTVKREFGFVVDVDFHGLRKQCFRKTTYTIPIPKATTPEFSISNVEEYPRPFIFNIFKFKKKKFFICFIRKWIFR